MRQRCRGVARPSCENKLVHVHKERARLLRVGDEQPGLRERLKCRIKHCLPVVQLQLFFKKMASTVGEDTSGIVY